VADPLIRCSWAGSAHEYIAYHDEEWGRPVHGETALFERISLEAFQSGLSWLTILRKRPAFRAAFANFSVDAVASYDEADYARLMDNAGIVRNRMKIAATIANAQAIRAGVDDLDELLWSFAPTDHRRPRGIQDSHATSPQSVALAKELKGRGLRFVGPTTAYALMQATGMVNDHVVDCWVDVSA
jgi:DNA-3-methyladenine glycosylase I